MIKRYLPDILCIVLIVIIVPLLVKKPDIEPHMRPSIEAYDTNTKGTKKSSKGIIRDIVSPKALEERNIFTPDSNQGISSTKESLPEDPYTLIGILKGEEKKAVIREHTGSIVTLREGDKLTDGSVITRIDTYSVEIEKGGEKKELRMFNVKIPKGRLKPPLPPG